MKYNTVPLKAGHTVTTIW